MLFKHLVTAKTDMHGEFYLQSDDQESRRFFAGVKGHFDLFRCPVEQKQ